MEFQIEELSELRVHALLTFLRRGLLSLGPDRNHIWTTLFKTWCWSPLAATRLSGSSFLNCQRFLQCQAHGRMLHFHCPICWIRNQPHRLGKTWDRSPWFFDFPNFRSSHQQTCWYFLKLRASLRFYVGKLQKWVDCKDKWEVQMLELDAHCQRHLRLPHWHIRNRLQLFSILSDTILLHLPCLRAWMHCFDVLSAL